MVRVGPSIQNTRSTSLTRYRCGRMVEPATGNPPVPHDLLQGGPARPVLSVDPDEQATVIGDDLGKESRDEIAAASRGHVLEPVRTKSKRFGAGQVSALPTQIRSAHLGSRNPGT